MPHRLTTGLLFIAVTALISVRSEAFAQDAADGPSETLATLHKTAATADWETYFTLFAEDATFIGTDVNETWTIADLRGYASQSTGWVYTQRSSEVTINERGDVAWFVEILDSQNYGTCRGTGVLIRRGAEWKIAQYHLTFPIPNDLARTITGQIKQFESTR